MTDTATREPTIYDEPVNEAVREPAEEAPARKGLLGRLRPPRPAERPPKERKESKAPVMRRTSAADVLTLAYGGTGKLLARGPDIPVGRAMEFNAPVAGPVLDRLLAKTWFDRWLLQRFSKRAKDLEEAMMVLGFPLLVGAAERGGPGAWPMLEPLLRQSIRVNLVAYAPVLRKMKAEEQKMAEALAELDLGFPDGVDPVSSILESIFAVPMEPAEPTTNGTAATEE